MSEIGPKRDEKLAELVNGVRKLKVDKADAMKGWKDAIDTAQAQVDAYALEILEGQKSLFSDDSAAS